MTSSYVSTGTLKNIMSCVSERRNLRLNRAIALSGLAAPVNCQVAPANVFAGVVAPLNGSSGLFAQETA